MSTATKAKPTINIHPLQDRVVILPSDDADSMRGRLYIPETAREKSTQGEVIAGGPGRLKKGQRVKVDVQAGDRVLYGKYSGTPYETGGDEMIIIKTSDILATIG